MSRKVLPCADVAGGPSLPAASYGCWIIFKTLVWGNPIAGYTSLMAVVLFLGGVQLIALGMIGEYLGRLYEESKQRPLYLIDRAVAPSGAGIADATTPAVRADEPRALPIGRSTPAG